MPTYCLKCREQTDSTEEEPFVSKNGRSMIRSRCIKCYGGKCRILGLAADGGAVDALSDEARHHAKLAGAAYEKPKERSEWLKDKDITNYSIDSDLSNDKDLVLHDPKTKKTVYSIRGTVPTSVADLASDLAIAMDSEKVFRMGGRYRNSLKKAQTVADKYGKENVTLAAHSLGATISSNVGKELGLVSHNYNTGSALSDVVYGGRDRIKCKVAGSAACERHKKNTNYYRTTLDPISLSSVSQVGTHHRVQQKGVDSHSISNFY